MDGAGKGALLRDRFLLESALRALQCAHCGSEHDADRVQQLCRCGGPLLARYDLAKAARTLSAAALAGRPRDLWRFRELLPVRDARFVVTLGEQPTPIVALPRWGRDAGLERVWLKDESQLPTGSFKARGAAVGVARARELGVKQFAMPSNGNAASAWSAYAASTDIQAIVVLPEDAPPVHRVKCALLGAKAYLVKGSISDAGGVVARTVAAHGLYDASTLKEPYRIEGKKTLGFEIAEQFDWRLPDVIVYPTGGGVGLIGMHKAFEELRAIGLLSTGKPRFIAVQSSGCAPIVRAWLAGRSKADLWVAPHTIAYGINVPKALGDSLILHALKESGGTAIAVDDDAIVMEQRALARREGILASLEGSATLAAVKRLRHEGVIASNETVVVVNTGGLLESSPLPAPPLPTVDRGEPLPL